MSSLPPAILFVAPSGTGKTTLLEKVIAELSRRGRRVGAVKHDAHRFEIDHEGKDSWRLTRAGASPMVVSSPEKIALVQSGLQEEVPLEELISRFMGGVELVIVEGYKGEGLPKVEVHRAAHRRGLLCATADGRVLDEDLVAVVSDARLELPVPLHPLDDPLPLCDFLEERFIAGKGRP